MERGILRNYYPDVAPKQALQVEGEKGYTSRVGPIGSHHVIGSMSMCKDCYGTWLNFRGDNSIEKEFPGQRIECLRMNDLYSEVTSLYSCETDSKRVRASIESTKTIPEFFSCGWCFGFPRAGMLSGRYNEFCNSYCHETEKKRKEASEARNSTQDVESSTKFQLVPVKLICLP